MTQHPVLKIMKPGKSLDSTDIRDFIFHSDYTMFKVDQILSGSISINSGYSSGYVEITHNLGKRAFLVYQDGQLLPNDVVAYNDGTKIRITRTLPAPYNQTITEYTASQAVFEDSLSSYYIIAGKKLSSGTGSAIRFDDVFINQGQTVTAAGFEWKNVTTTTGADIKFKIWGIDQDNTNSFSDYGDASGKPRTDAYREKTQSPGTNFNFGDDWRTLVQEIVNRSGWSSGNNMGFIFNDNGSPDGKVIAMPTSGSLNDIVLTITLTGTGSLTSNYKIVVFKDKIA